ncbi:hypothetical protein FRC11_009049 [Ceratobasidium sp. 423]|nr:hypothetical protein FRC11_009049 [Ceratobasidium sp. 423]
MSDEEEDYLSDKFLASLEAPKPDKSNISYAERRRIAQRESERKRVEGRIKSRREMEEEARREGLSRSLFEKDADAEGGQSSNKAMSMMLKMGFKPGESLGRKEEPVKPPSDNATDAKPAEEPEKVKSGHLTEPLPLAVWAGRKGLGLGKRAMSPPLGGSSKAAKASAEEDAAEKSRNENFRAQARGGYEERRDEGRLRAALRTCANLDEKNGVKFNVLQLNPFDPSSIPEALYDLLIRTPAGAIEEGTLDAKPGYRVPVGESDFDEGVGTGGDRAIAARLREQMKADSLRPLKESNEDFLAMRDAVKEDTPKQEVVDDQIDFDQETVDAAKEYLQKNAITTMRRTWRQTALDQTKIHIEFLVGEYSYSCTASFAIVCWCMPHVTAVISRGNPEIRRFFRKFQNPDPWLQQRKVIFVCYRQRRAPLVGWHDALGSQHSFLIALVAFLDRAR